MSPARIYILMATVLLLGSVNIAAEGAPDTVAVYPGIEITTEVDRSEIYIGDLITYTVTIKYDSTYELIPPPLGANLGAFDVKDYEPDILIRLEDGRFQSTNRFVLSTFTTGDYVIPPIPVVFNLPDGTRKALVSEGVPIKVLSLLGNESDSLDIKPLKAQYEFNRDYTPYYFWGGIAFLFLLVVGVLIWLKLRGKREDRESVDLRPAWEIAFEDLALLNQKNLPQDERFKQYYVELTDIVRRYYERMYDLNVMDMTTEEFVSAFGRLELPERLLERMEDFFAHADLVKFAKFVPDRHRCESDFEEIHAAVELVRADWDRRLLPHLSDDSSADDSTPPALSEEVVS